MKIAYTILEQEFPIYSTESNKDFTNMVFKLTNVVTKDTRIARQELQKHGYDFVCRRSKIINYQRPCNKVFFFYYIPNISLNSSSSLSLRYDSVVAVSE